ncbi:MAG: hypothetical protein GF330_09030 [Candidatus Eisenbacteria bacterium]|nr:hypothetical protein [Candidatus Eisenbacteria bacterium]
MTRSSRAFLIVFGLTALLLSVAVAAVAVSVHRCGILRVDVHDWEGDGQHIRLRMPGVVVPIAVQLVPDAAFGEVPGEVLEHIELMEVACDALARQPDFLMIEVHDAREHVTIAKQGDDLVIEVESPDEDVHIMLPLSLVKSMTARLARLPACKARSIDRCRDGAGAVFGHGSHAIVVES